MRSLRGGTRFESSLRGVLRTVGLAEPLRTALEPVSSSIRAAFVYGSIAKATDRATCDLGLMIVSDNLTYGEVFNLPGRATKHSEAGQSDGIHFRGVLQAPRGECIREPGAEAAEDLDHRWRGRPTGFGGARSRPAGRSYAAAMIPSSVAVSATALSTHTTASRFSSSTCVVRIAPIGVQNA